MKHTEPKPEPPKTEPPKTEPTPFQRRMAELVERAREIERQAAELAADIENLSGWLP